MPTNEKTLLYNIVDQKNKQPIVPSLPAKQNTQKMSKKLTDLYVNFVLEISKYKFQGQQSAVKRLQIFIKFQLVV